MLTLMCVGLYTKRLYTMIMTKLLLHIENKLLLKYSYLIFNAIEKVIGKK